MNKTPLILRGFYNNANSSAAGTSDAVAANTTWTNVLPTGRGKLIMIDLLEAQNFAGITWAPNGQATLKLGGQSLFLNAVMSTKNIQALPAPLPVLMDGGQTIQLNLNWPAGISPEKTTAWAVCNFENPYDTPEIRNAINYAAAKQRTYDFVSQFAFGIKSNKKSFTIPSGMGNIVGIQLIGGDNTNGSSIGISIGQVIVDGVQIIQDCPAGMAQISSLRNTIWPILIEGGNTLEIDLDTSNAGAGNIFWGVKLFFDNILNGNPYKCNC
jgi:hypothetical protein